MLIGRLGTQDERCFLVRLEEGRLALDEEGQPWTLTAELSALAEPAPWQRHAFRVQREDGLVFALSVREEERRQLADAYRALTAPRRRTVSPLAA